MSSCQLTEVAPRPPCSLSPKVIREKAGLWQLLGAEEPTGIRLTETFAMLPAASVSGLYFAHPQASYFAVDLITRDQVEAYAARKHRPRAEVERWLAPNLAYEP